MKILLKIYFLFTPSATDYWIPPPPQNSNVCMYVQYRVSCIENGFILEKAKIVVASWGTELLQFHSTLAIFH